MRIFVAAMAAVALRSQAFYGAERPVKYDRTVIGYHGCEKEIADLLLRGAPFASSENVYDWLGRGTYFWEFGADRAARWSERYQANGGPAVVGAIIQLGNCFDLLDTRFTTLLSEAFSLFEKSLVERGLQVPVNKGGTPDRKLRNLDCAYLNWYLEAVAEDVVYDTVRGCFSEGGPCFPGSGLQMESHIQIAVRNPSAIVGIFLPTAGSEDPAETAPSGQVAMPSANE